MASAAHRDTRPFDPWLDRIADPDSLPDLYAVPCTGACMEPEIADGTSMVFDRRREPAPGDLIGIWLLPEFVPSGEASRMLKRLVYPAGAGKKSRRGEPAIVVEMLNPRKLLAVECARIQAIHCCVGPAVIDAAGRATIRMPAGEE